MTKLVTLMRMTDIRNFFVSASILDSSSCTEISDSDESDRHQGHQEFLRLITHKFYIPEKETKAPAENEMSEEEDLQISHVTVAISFYGSHLISPDEYWYPR